MKRLNYLSAEGKIISFTFEDDFTGNVIIVTEGSTNPFLYESISVPIEQLERFIQDYKQVTETVKFAGLA